MSSSNSVDVEMQGSDSSGNEVSTALDTKTLKARSMVRTRSGKALWFAPYVRKRDAKAPAAKRNSATFAVICDLAPGYVNFRA
jgi:hypothetical protein